MNTKNNKRKRESCEKIEKIFSELVLKKNINKISVTEICQKTGLNRSTFYANYVDVYDLADKIRKKLEDDFQETFTKAENHSALAVFRLIYEQQAMFKVYFELGYDERYYGVIHDAAEAERYFEGRYVKYHAEFFRSGLNSVIKMWLEGGCRETPEEMADIIKNEYRGRKK